MPSSTALTFDPSRPAPQLAGGSLLLALAALVPGCDHTQADDARLAPSRCSRCHRTWALLECVLGGFSLFAAEREWVREGAPVTLLVQLEAISGGGAPLRELATLFGLDFPGTPPAHGTRAALATPGPRS